VRTNAEVGGATPPESHVLVGRLHDRAGQPWFLVAALGGSIANWAPRGAVLWVISVLLGVSEQHLRRAGHHVPGEVRRIAVYAHEAWRRYFSRSAPLATFGYWFACPPVLSIMG